MSFPPKKFFVAAIATAIFFASLVRAQESLQTHYAAPEPLADANDRLSAIAGELDNPADAPSVADAALRFDAVVRDSVHGLIANADGSESTVRCWTKSLSDLHRKTLSMAMEQLEGSTARQAMDDLRNATFADPIDYYAVAQRYPLNATAGEALRAAAAQSKSLGDETNSLALTAIAAGATPPIPRIIGDEVPAAMTWFGLPGRTAWAAMRTVPVLAAGLIFVAGPTEVMALSSDFKLVWRGPAAEGDGGKRGVSDPNGSTRGPTYRPALFAPDNESPAVVVVRQSVPSPSHDGRWAIRALRGSDGQLLWSSEANPELTRLVFGSSPTVVGRYVYAVAGECGDDLDRMALVAMELTTGKVLWRCDIGSVAHPPIVPRHLRPGTVFVSEMYRPWLNQSSPSVTGDAVVFAPNIGAVVAVDRFDGSLQWVHPYTPVGMPSVDPNASALAARAAQIAAIRDHPGQPVTLPIRWSNAVAIDGTRVIVAPQDSTSVAAYDLRDGHSLWETSQIPLLNPGRLESPVETLRSFTLLGMQHGCAVLQGASLIALNISDGTIVRRTEPLTGITGPGVIRSGRILLPTRDHGVMECDDVSSIHPSPISMFNEALKIEPVRKALQTMNVSECFAISK